jgi:hypothetical protein
LLKNFLSENFCTKTFCPKRRLKNGYQDGVDDGLVAGDDGLHEARVEVHEDVEEVERQPGNEEDEGDAQDHDVGPAPLLVVLGVLALHGQKRGDQGDQGPMV